MFRNERLEMKVGLFIGIGIFVMFFIVFSISDIYLLGEGYNIRVLFDYVNGIDNDSPVRLAGVHVGEVKDVSVYYDDAAGKTRVKLDVWINGNTKVEKDAVAAINTLGLLGEQYLEITPGVSKEFLAPDEALVGKNPVNVQQQMEKITQLTKSIGDVMAKVERGEGTLGKLLNDDTIYNDLEIIFGRLSRGEGTIGKLLVEEKIYDDLEGFVSDIKAHPWRLLQKTADTKENPAKTGDAKKGTSIVPAKR